MKQNNGFSGIYESAHFANILIEFENDTREMAVDVPESFVAQTKTPPKYPPPSSLGDREEARSSGSSFSALSLSNGHSLNRKSSPLPPNRYIKCITIRKPVDKKRLLLTLMEALLNPLCLVINQSYFLLQGSYPDRAGWKADKHHGGPAPAHPTTKPTHEKVRRGHCQTHSRARKESSPK